MSAFDAMSVTRKHRGLHAALIAAILLIGICLPSVSHASAYVQATCQVSNFIAQCHFTNTGSSTATACATVNVVNAKTRASTASSVVCSGEIPASATTASPVMFPAVQPGELCASGWSDCAVEVTMGDVRETGFGSLATWLLTLLVVVGTSLWVYGDSKAIRTRSGLGVGRHDAGNWLAFCLLFWILAFPTYLVQRAATLAQEQRRGWCSVLWTDGLVYPAQLLQEHDGSVLIQLQHGSPTWVPAQAVRRAA